MDALQEPQPRTCRIPKKRDHRTDSQTADTLPAAYTSCSALTLGFWKRYAGLQQFAATAFVSPRLKKQRCTCYIHVASAEVKNPRHSRQT